MVTSCIVENCNLYFYKNNASFYRIPSVISVKNKSFSGHPEGIKEIVSLSKQRRDAWVRVLRCISLTESQLKGARVCSEHFNSGKSYFLQYFS